MEPAPLNTSAPSSSDRFIRIRKSVISALAVIVPMGIVLGGVILYLVHSLPYNRIVVFNQPTSTAVLITSVRLQKPGFVVISMLGDGGWVDVGSSLYLRPGYYRNIIVDIGYILEFNGVTKDKNDGNFVSRSFVARLAEYKGKTYEYDPRVDTIVTTKGGAIYQKRFWWESHGSTIRHFLVRLQDNPFEFLWDILLP